MKTEAARIAEKELVMVRAGGEKVAIIVEIGQPYQSAEGEWRTPVALHGLHERLSDICGEDSLQSLSLAVEFIRRRLASVVERGDQLIDAEGDDFHFDVYFPKM
jgi:hypothetical protein